MDVGAFLKKQSSSAQSVGTSRGEGSRITRDIRIRLRYLLFVIVVVDICRPARPQRRWR